MTLFSDIQKTTLKNEASKNAYRCQGYLAQDAQGGPDYHANCTEISCETLLDSCDRFLRQYLLGTFWRSDQRHCQRDPADPQSQASLILEEVTARQGHR